MVPIATQHVREWVRANGRWELMQATRIAHAKENLYKFLRANAKHGLSLRNLFRRLAGDLPHVRLHILWDVVVRLLHRHREYFTHPRPLGHTQMHFEAQTLSHAIETKFYRTRHRHIGDLVEREGSIAPTNV